MVEELTVSPDEVQGEEEAQEETQEEVQTEKQIIDVFQKEKKRYEQSSQTERSVIKEIYKVYEGKMDENTSTPYDTKETVPKLRTEISYIKPFIFSGEPEIEIEPVGEEDKEMSMVYEKMVNYRIQQSIPNAYEKIEAWVHQAVTFGTSLIKVVWNFETKKEVGENGEEFETPVTDEPDLEVPNILDAYYNSLMTEVDGQKSMIFRSVLTIDVVRENPIYNYQAEDGELNVDKLKGKGNLKSDTYNSSSMQDSQLLTNQHGVVEIWDRIAGDRIQTIAEGEKTLVLRDVENPYGMINTVKFLFEPNTIPNTFDGLGVGHNTLGLGKMHYKMFNQILTNVKMTNNPMFLFTKGSRIDKKQTVSRPGGGIEVTTDGGPLSNYIQPLLFPDIKSGASELLNLITDEHQRASGANDLLQGSASNDTLGQDEIAQANTSNRFELIVRRFKHALAEVGGMILKMEIQNLQSPDAPILRIFPQDIRGRIYEAIINDRGQTKYNIKVKGDTNIAKNKNLQSKRLVDLFDLSQNFLTDQEKRSFLRRIAEKQGEDGIDEIIGENNPVADQTEQMEAGMHQMPGGEMMPNDQMPQQQYNQVGATGGQPVNY